MNLKNFLEHRYLMITAVAMIIFLPFFIVLYNFSKEFEEHKEKVGLIILGDIQQVGWNEAHYKGISAACKKFEIELLVRDKIRENSGQCTEAIKELAENGAGLIVLASYAYSSEVQNLVGEYPKIAFATNSAEIHAKNLTSYFVRMYQARYLAGALAGMKTKSNVIGYVAAMNNSEVNRGINAFTLGVQRVNPNAKVVVIWTGAWQDEEREAINAARLIEEVGADVLTYHQDEETVGKVAEKYDVDFISYNAVLDGFSDHYLASITCDWELYYTNMLQRYLKGEINSVKNNWIGIDRGAVALSIHSPAVDEKMKFKIDSMRQELINNKFIFSGPIYDNKGNLRCEEGDAISDDVLLEDINWLIKGVEVLE